MFVFFKKLIDHPMLIGMISFYILIGFLSDRRRKNSSFEEYALASRSLPTIILIMTLLATFIGAGDLYIPNLIAKYGLPFVVVHMTYLGIVFWVIGTFVAPCLVYYRRSMTMGDLMGIFYGPIGQLVTGVVGVSMSLIMIMTQISAIGSLGSSLLGLDPYMSILCFGAVFVWYSVWGGMRAVSYTDVLQIFFVAIVLSLVARLLLNDVGGVKGISDYLTNKKDVDTLLFWKNDKLKDSLKELCFWNLSCSFSLTLPAFQRMLMVKNKRQVREMWYMSAFCYAVFLFILALATFAGCVLREKMLVDEEGDLLLQLVNYLFKGNSWVKDFVCIGLLGLLLSTADSFLHAVGISVLHDVMEPLKLWMHGRKFSAKRKSSYARLVVTLIGFLTLFGALPAYRENPSIWKESWCAFAIVLYGLVIWPLLLGIFGLKTDKFSFLTYCICYISCTVAFSWAEWEKYDYFWIVVGASLITYCITHVIIHRGFAILNRGKYTTTEKLWTSFSPFSLKSFFHSSLDLPARARCRLLTCASPSPLTFSLALFTLYTLQCMISAKSYDIFDLVSGVRGIGVMLCVVLLSEWAWSKHWQQYYALYWFVTVFFCLPFAGTFVFLQKPETIFTVVHWIGIFMFLACLVDSSLFIKFGLLGILGASTASYFFGRGLKLNSTGWTGVYGVLLLFIFVAVFKRKKDRNVQEKLYWNRITTTNLVREISDPLQMLNGIGNMISTAFTDGHQIVDAQGREGFFIHQRQYKFLDRFSTHIIERAREAQKDLNHFTKFIEQQIMGIFVEQNVSMHGFVKEGVRRVSSQYLDKIKVRLTCTEDFKAKVLSSVFPNVIASLISSAYHHGHASLVEVTVDGNQRKISIRDNGEGIPPEIFPYIFDLHYTESRMHKAGLAFTRMVIEASGGRVSCYSKYGGEDSFTKFVIELP